MHPQPIRIPVPPPPEPKRGRLEVLSVIVTAFAIALLVAFVDRRSVHASPAETTVIEAVTDTAIAGVASVIDADTIEIHGERIRLDGIDAPESGQRCASDTGRLYRCGGAAAKALDAFIAGAPVRCTPMGKDRYKRVLAACEAHGESLNAWLVRQGYALAYRQYSAAYIADETIARDSRAGVWSGEFVPPWEWRKGARLAIERPLVQTSSLEQG